MVKRIKQAIRNKARDKVVYLCEKYNLSVIANCTIDNSKVREIPRLSFNNKNCAVCINNLFLEVYVQLVNYYTTGKEAELRKKENKITDN